MSLTADRAIDMVFKRLGNRTQTTALRQSVINELNAAQIEFESGPEFPFFLEKVTEANQVLLNANSEFEVPSDYLAFVEEKPVTYVKGNDEVDLELRPYDELIAKYNSNAEGMPSFFARKRATRYQVFPKVSTGYMRLYYYAKQPLLSPDGTLPPVVENYWYRFAPYLLVCKAAYEIAGGYLKDMALAEKLKADTADKYQQMISLNVSQESNLRDLSQMPLRNWSKV
jgi:hypothetical protein